MSYVEIKGGPRNEPTAKLSVCVNVMITKRNCGGFKDFT